MRISYGTGKQLHLHEFTIKLMSRELILFLGTVPEPYIQPTLF
jgi:hypothetical protein